MFLSLPQKRCRVGQGMDWICMIPSAAKKENFIFIAKYKNLC